MARGKTTALVARDSGDVAIPKHQITMSAATDLVKALAAERLRAAREESREKRAQLEAAVGGHTKRVDDTVVDQAKALMTRLALIANHQETSHQDGTELKKVVGKLGAVVGELQTIMLTSRAIGLFERIDDSDYKGYSYGGDRGSNPLSHAGRKIQAEARELLEQYEIVADPRKGKRAKNGETAAEPQIVTVDELAADPDAEIDDEFLDEDVDDA